jgi:hypothetical protein
MFNAIRPEGAELIARALHVSIYTPLTFYSELLTSDILEITEQMLM